MASCELPSDICAVKEYPDNSLGGQIARAARLSSELAVKLDALAKVCDPLLHPTEPSDQCRPSAVYSTLHTRCLASVNDATEEHLDKLSSIIERLDI